AQSETLCTWGSSLHGTWEASPVSGRACRTVSCRHKPNSPVLNDMCCQLVTPEIDGHTVTFLPSIAPVKTSVTIARPDLRSTPLAQVTLPKVLAAISLPSLASST